MRSPVRVVLIAGALLAGCSPSGAPVTSAPVTPPEAMSALDAVTTASSEQTAQTGRAVVHEPAYWLGIRYTQLTPALAWSGTGDLPASRARQVDRMREVCADPQAWVRSVS